MRIEPTLHDDSGGRARKREVMRDHDIYTPSSPMVLLHFAIFAMSLLATGVAARSVGKFSWGTIAWCAAGFAVVVAFSAWLRPLLRDLATDFTLRERAAIGLLHVIAFVAPSFFVKPCYFVYNLLALLVCEHFLLTERQHFTRLLALQTLILLVAQLTTLHDDIYDFAASILGVALLALAAFAMRTAFVMEKYEVTFPVTPRRLVGSLLPTFAALALVTLAVGWFVAPTPYKQRPSIGLEYEGARSMRISSSDTDTTARIARFLFDGTLVAIGLVASIWLVARIRDRLARKSAKDLALDLTVDIAAEGDLPAASTRHRAPPRDVRQRIIDAYVDFCRRAGRALRRERARDETPHEYEDALLADARLHPRDAAVRALTADFERARYGPDDISADEAKSFVERTRDLTKWLAGRSDGPVSRP